jgi:hypothetical protein
LMVVDFEEFKTDFRREYIKICDFLGVDAIESPPEKYNASKKIYSPCLQFILRKTTDNLVSLCGDNQRINRLTLKVISLFFRNSTSLYLKTGKKVSLSHLWNVYRRFKDETAKNNFAYNPSQKKEERDFLLQLGTIQGEPAGIRQDTREKLLSSYQADINKLENILHRPFEHWISENSESVCV